LHYIPFTLIFKVFGGFMPKNGFCNNKSKKLKIQTAHIPRRGVLKPRTSQPDETPHVAPKIKNPQRPPPRILTKQKS
jgi:hypothetical protein